MSSTQDANSNANPTSSREVRKAISYHLYLLLNIESCVLYGALSVRLDG